jgi:hypothetical protein
MDSSNFIYYTIGLGDFAPEPKQKTPFLKRNGVGFTEFALWAKLRGHSVG